MPEVTKVVEVVPYDPNWKQEFVKVKDMINNYIGDLIATISNRV